MLAHMIQFSLDNNHACSINGTIHFAFPDAQKLVLNDVRYEPGIKKVCFLWINLICMVIVVLLGVVNGI